jgi:hypothetical protein
MNVVSTSILFDKSFPDTPLTTPTPASVDYKRCASQDNNLLMDRRMSYPVTSANIFLCDIASSFGDW